MGRCMDTDEGGAGIELRASNCIYDAAYEDAVFTGNRSNTVLTVVAGRLLGGNGDRSGIGR